MKPKIKSTVKPDVRLSFTDWQRYIKRETKTIYSSKGK